MRRLDNRGQSQILAVVALSAVMTSVALISVDYSRQTANFGVQILKRVEMRNALDEAVRYASYLYRNESGCDPVVLNAKLSRMVPTGAINGLASPPAPTNRYLQIGLNSQTYNVSFGQVTALQWNGGGVPAADPSLDGSAPTPFPVLAGTSQDADIEVWTTYGLAPNAQRMVQRAVLINTCTYPCSLPLNNGSEAAQTGSFPCGTGQGDAAISYLQINANTGPACNGGRKPGDLNGACGSAPDGFIDMQDVILLRNYLRSADASGTCVATMIGNGAANSACADLNLDGRVDEIDLNILEKVLRGYIQAVPTHY
jgi:hypothetical protein